jgi:hypothetical protein
VSPLLNCRTLVLPFIKGVSNYFEREHIFRFFLFDDFSPLDYVFDAWVRVEHVITSAAAAAAAAAAMALFNLIFYYALEVQAIERAIVCISCIIIRTSGFVPYAPVTKTFQ